MRVLGCSVCVEAFMYSAAARVNGASMHADSLHECMHAWTNVRITSQEPSEQAPISRFRTIRGSRKGFRIRACRDPCKNEGFRMWACRTPHKTKGFAFEHPEIIVKTRDFLGQARSKGFWGVEGVVVFSQSKNEKRKGFQEGILRFF